MEARLVVCFFTLVLSKYSAAIGQSWDDASIIHTAYGSLSRARAVASDPPTVYLVAILPNDTLYLPSFDKVGPALKLAMDKVVERQLLPAFRMQLSYRDSRCSNVYAPLSAVDAYKFNQVHAFFGKRCSGGSV